MKTLLCWRLLLLLGSAVLLTRAVPRDYPDVKDTAKGPTRRPLRPSTLQNLPKLPDGHKQFQFFNLGSGGKLHKQWMSLQEVQNIIVAYALSRQTERVQLKPAASNSHLEGAFVTKPLRNNTEKLPLASVADVLANVQKVVSKEMTNNIRKNKITTSRTPLPLPIPEGRATTTTTPNSNDNLAHNTLPSTLLTYLMGEQMSSLETNNPWGITTDMPATIIFNPEYFTTDKETLAPAASTTFNDETLLQENFLVDRFQAYSTSASIPTKDRPATTQSGLETTETTTSSFELATEGDMKKGNDVLLSEEVTSSPGTDEIMMSHNTQQDNTLFDNPTENPVLSLDANTQAIIHTTSLSLSDITQRPISNVATRINTKFIQDRTTSKPHESTLSQLDVENGDMTENILLNTQSPSTMPEGTLAETTAASTFAIYPDASQIGNSSDNSGVNHLISKSSISSASSNLKPPGFETNVLTPIEMAQLPLGNVKNLALLQAHGNYYDYNIDDPPLYLEDLDEMTYDYVDSRPKPLKPTNTHHAKPMDFPRPETANSYHKPEHVSDGLPNENVNVLQFLPAFNHALAEGKNPLRKTPPGNQGLQITVASLDPEIRKYVDTMNDVAFQVYKEAIKIHRRQNLVMSPLNLISTLWMMLLGARHKSASSISQFMQGDRFLMFNPHLVLNNITKSALNLNNIGHESAFVNNLFTQKSLIEAYPLDHFTRILEHFYTALVEQVSQEDMGSVARDRANERVREQTAGAVQNFLKPNASFQVLGPLGAVSSAYFQGKWDVDFTKADLIDMNFIRFPSAERRLIRTVGISKRMQLNAGYSEELDATVAEVPLKSDNHDISLILVMPGQQKSFVANGLSQLEKSLTSEQWTKLLKTVIPHNLNFKMPIFSHRNYLNLSGILSRIGLKKLFEESADFSGINGAKNLYLGDVIQLSEFHSCKLDMRMFSSRAVNTPIEKSLAAVNEREVMKSSSSQTRVEEAMEAEISAPSTMEDAQNGGKKTRHRSEASKRSRNESSGADKTLAYDRAFFYVLRHNPTGFILFIGRYLDPETF